MHRPGPTPRQPLLHWMQVRSWMHRSATRRGMAAVDDRCAANCSNAGVRGEERMSRLSRSRELRRLALVGGPVPDVRLVCPAFCGVG